MAEIHRKKLVSFFEVVSEEGQEFPEAIDWQEFFAGLTILNPEDRRYRINRIPHWGKVYPYMEEDHFILARVREEGVSSFDVEKDEIIDGETDSAKPWVEVSILSFVPGTNKFGFVLGSQASPRATTFALWLNEHNIFDQKVSIKPLVSRDVLAKINGAAEARLLTVTLSRDHVSEIESAGGIFSAARALSDEHGDVEVELSIKVKGRLDNSHKAERISISRSARGVAGREFKKATAKLINYDDEGKPEVEYVDFLNDRLAKRMKVRVTDGDGNPIKVQSAVDAIYKAMGYLRDELDSG